MHDTISYLLNNPSTDTERTSRICAANLKFKTLIPFLALVATSEPVYITQTTPDVFTNKLEYKTAAPGVCYGEPRAWEFDLGYTNATSEGLTDLNTARYGDGHLGPGWEDSSTSDNIYTPN